MSVSPASRDEVVSLIDGSIANVNLRRHMLATEAVMRGLAVRLGARPRASGASPVSRTTSTPKRPRATSRATAPGRRSGSPSWACRPTSSTPSRPTTPRPAPWPRGPIDVALIAADQTTGLITAATLVRPDRSLPQVKLSSVRKRMREGAFARGVDRASILRCEELGLELDEFLAIALAAMQGVAADLGLAGE